MDIEKIRKIATCKCEVIYSIPILTELAHNVLELHEANKELSHAKHIADMINANVANAGLTDAEFRSLARTMCNYKFKKGGT